ncbi:MAG: hypothetical protein AB1659_09530, partial [Thermodesulfobacteriota bacterium]
MKVTGSYEVATLSGLGNNYPLVLLISETLATKNQKAAAALVRGHATAVDLMNQDPERAAGIIAGVTGASPQFELKVMQSLEWRVYLGYEVRESLSQTRDFLYEMKKISFRPDLSKFMDDRFLKP